MILNLLVIGVVLGLTVLWSTHGLFSSFLQFLAVVIAGALAFAVWEPVTVGFLLNLIPDYGWAVGLVLPFAAFLILLRLLVDKAAPSDLKFNGLVGQILGGVFGFFTGILATGLVAIGFMFLPFGENLFGWNGAEVRGNGVVERTENARLWIPVDTMAASFFARLSNSGFSSANPLARFYPDLAFTAATHRVGRQYDEFGSLSAQTDSVAINRVLGADVPVEDVSDLPFELIEYFAGTDPNADEQLVVIEATYELVGEGKGSGTFDKDNNLRVPPYQATLLTLPRDADDAAPFEEHLPVGFSKDSVSGAQREFFPVSDNATLATSNFQPATIAWVYAIPTDADPAFFRFRNLRFGLDEAEAGEPMANTLGELADAVGEYRGEAASTPTANNPDSPEERVGDRVSGPASNHKAVALEQTAKVPVSVSANVASGLDITGGKITGGRGTVSGSMRSNTSADELAVGGGKRMIRLSLKPYTAVAGLTSRSQLGAAPSDVQIFLEDASGRPFYAVAYAWKSGDKTEIDFSSGLLRASGNIPVARMQPDDDLYIYFEVPVGVRLTRYVMDPSFQDVDYTVVN